MAAGDLIDPTFITDPKLLRLADLANLISDASEMIQTHCRRTFAQAALTESYDGTGRGRVWLRRPPIASVTSVTIDGWAPDNTDGTAWSFDPGPHSGELRRGPGLIDIRFVPAFPKGLQNIVVT